MAEREHFPFPASGWSGVEGYARMLKKDGSLKPGRAAAVLPASCILTPNTWSLHRNHGRHNYTSELYGPAIDRLSDRTVMRIVEEGNNFNVRRLGNPN
ncbi:hypothetical protein EYF80_037058 [Liparis tanakae]|uniref:Uncharacterized protein n=1 Tax=Liparis tanakae TaxID=230148 RepID=A0A4Z2GIY6_9TELE|nr:hypothetical protein EYF80_037058 [Liparis tanakae]